MLRPFNCLQIDALLDKLPQRTQLAQEVHALLDCIEHVLDLGLGGKSANPEPNAAVRVLVAVAQRAQHVTWLQRGRCAGTPRGERDVFEGHEERLAFDVGKGDVDAAGVTALRVTVQHRVLH